MKKNVLITGTSTGVGFESAILFAQKGFKVYASMRNLAKAKKLEKQIDDEKLDIELLELDVTKPSTIEKAIKTIVEKDKKIDILINNAGAGFAKTTENASLEEIKWVTDVNYLGVVNCTKAILPYMRTQKFGRIINITSVGGLVGQPFNELYCGAKFAVEGYTEALASYLTASFNIQFSLIEPGGISTEFANSAMSNTIVEGQLAEGDYAPIMQKYISGMQKRAAEGEAGTYQTGRQVAEVILKVTESEKPPLRIRTSEWAESFCQLKTMADPDGTKLVNEVIERFL